MPAAILFDLDGTLIDSYDTWFHLTHAGCRAFGMPEVSAEAFAEGWGQSVQQDAARYFGGRTLAEVQDFYDAHYMDHVEHVRVDPAARGVLMELAARGVKVAIVTNTPQPLAGRIVTYLELVADTVVGDNEAPHAKPAPDMLHLALKRLAVSAPQAWMVGDSRFDAEAAARAEVRFAGLHRAGDRRLAELAEALDLP